MSSDYYPPGVWDYDPRAPWNQPPDDDPDAPWNQEEDEEEDGEY